MEREQINLLIKLSLEAILSKEYMDSNDMDVIENELREVLKIRRNLYKEDIRELIDQGLFEGVEFKENIYDIMDGNADLIDLKDQYLLSDRSKEDKKKFLDFVHKTMEAGSEIRKSLIIRTIDHIGN